MNRVRVHGLTQSLQVEGEEISAVTTAQGMDSMSHCQLGCDTDGLGCGFMPNTPLFLQNLGGDDSMVAVTGAH